jgi:hypothetical protein
VTVTLGWWCVPLLITLLLAVWQVFPVEHDAYGIMSMLKLLLSVIIALIAWLVYAVFT